MRRLLSAAVLLAAIPAGATAAGSADRPLLTYVAAPVAVGPVGASLGVCATDLQGHHFRLTDPRYDAFRSWSPDGSLIAFSGPADPPGEDHAVDLFVADPQGRNARDLTRGGGRGSPGEVFGWSPDGSELGGNWSGLGSSVFIAKTDGTGLRLLASTNYGEYVFGESWSPDGSRILLSRSSFANMVPAISVIDVDGTNERKLLGAADAASWSPDGQQFVYYSYPDWPRATGLGVAQADGSNAHLLVSGVTLTGRPRWSPDGSRLAYVESGNLGVVRADGSDARVLAKSVTGSPQWSPDGSLVAFARGAGQAARIAVINADGSGEHEVAAGSDPVWRVPAQLPSNRRRASSAGPRGLTSSAVPAEAT